MAVPALNGFACAQMSALEKAWPTWVPSQLVNYVAHVELGLSVRAIARELSCHASTISRQINRWEQLRDDTLVDAALAGLVTPLSRNMRPAKYEDDTLMETKQPQWQSLPDDETFASDALRILRRLSEKGAVLALAGDMEKGVVVRETTSGTALRTAIVDRGLAQALALKEWITCTSDGRVARYQITNVGRAALNKLLAEAENHASGFAEAPAVFSFDGTEVNATPSRRSRYSSGDSPLMILARRRDKDGGMFLTSDQVNAGERLREDYELAQLVSAPTPDLRAIIRGEAALPEKAAAPLSSEAGLVRVATALSELGEGLGEVALRCCCQLEGVESAERALGWSARSGKIVLRIALTRLARHYAAQSGGMMIG